MKKIYTILTSLIILILVVHMIYMTLSVMNLITPNEDFAQNLGYTLMYLAILHGIYGLVKWIGTLLHQKRLFHLEKHPYHEKPCHAVVTTRLQRILGIVILVIIIPHGYIKVLSADALLLLTDICYMIALFVHLWIGFPKWIVSLGLKPANKNWQANVTDGGNKKWK